MLIKRALSRIAGRSFIQAFLEKNIRVSQYLRGVGSGTDVTSSGENAIFNLLKHQYRPPYCIFDVGSNKGQFVEMTLQNLDIADVSIHCFEPGIGTFKSLQSFYEGLLKPNRIILNNCGIGKNPGAATLHFDSTGSGLASLTKRRLDHFGIDFDQSENVTIETVDNYCIRNGIGHIHLLKLDIEGHELDALEGATAMFESESIDIVAFEFGGCNIDTRTFFRDFWYFFKNYHMRIFRITPSGFLANVASYDEIHEQFKTTNFVAAKSASLAIP